MEVERDSARFHYPEKNEEEMNRDEKMAYNELRGRSFRATIEKAFEKASTDGQKLICHVGGAHSTLRDFDLFDYPVGEISEARFFNEVYEKTRGKIPSFNVCNISSHPFSDPVLQELFIDELENTSMIFLDLKKLATLDMENLFMQFISPSGYKYHGLIVIK